ncbi:MAG: hypothetical protein WBG70_08965 [Spirulinaceae cyanobacterium]
MSDKNEQGLDSSEDSELKGIKSVTKALTVGLMWSFTGLLPPKKSQKEVESEELGDGETGGLGD